LHRPCGQPPFERTPPAAAPVTRAAASPCRLADGARVATAGPQRPGRARGRSRQDALTGLANRRAFELALAREIDRVARSGEPALLLALDIDHFKRINDTHGHAAGDTVLRAVANALLDSVRPMDLVARVGGEEFAIVLPNCAAAFGETVAERVRQRIERMPILVGGVGGVGVGGTGQQINCTVSIGGAFAPQWVRSTPALWVERADQQLYGSKTSGRNRAQLEPTAVSVVSNEERRALFETFQAQDHE
jgi:diguanylate cyclase